MSKRGGYYSWRASAIGRADYGIPYRSRWRAILDQWMTPRRLRRGIELIRAYDIKSQSTEP